jgi:quercetin dioxygenase-like cupin family protein
MRGTVLDANALKVVERGSGIRTIPLFGGHNGALGFASGMTVFPPGGGIVMHYHNVEESVTVLEGNGTAYIDGEEMPVSKYTVTHVPANVPHRFVNTGDTEMRILWVYGGTDVTRTIVETGETIQHLSPEDTTGTKG